MLERPDSSIRTRGTAIVRSQNRKSSTASIEKLETRALLSSAVLFNSPVKLIAGSHPQAVVTADFNGDGKPDIAVANEGSNTVTVYLGNGDGTFAQGVTLPTGNQPDSLIAADVNGDGHADLIVSNYTDHTVEVFLGKGDGTFKSHTRITSIPGGLGQNAGLTHSAEPIALADVNGDGKLDLITANGLAGTFSVFLGNGDGTFAAPISTTIVGNEANAFSIATGDFNKDGHTDVVLTDPSNGDIQIFAGNGDGHFQSPNILLIHDVAPFTTLAVNSTGVYPNSVEVGDLNGDGNPDLVVTNKYLPYTGVITFLGNGDGNFKTGQFVATDRFPFSATIADINGDGIPDIITANAGKQGQPSSFRTDVSILIGNDDGTFVSAQNIPAQTYVTSVATADFNGDGDPDIVTANAKSYSVSVLINNGPADTLINGTLFIRGTPANDTVTLTAASGQITSNVDGFIRTYSAASISSIHLHTFRGSDSINIGAGVGAVLVRSGKNSDTIVANNSADDSLFGGKGFDSITVSAGDNYMDGGLGADTLVAGSGSDTLLGDNGPDSLVGSGFGSDSIGGNTYMDGGVGNDTIEAGTGNDTIKGEDGNDSITGGIGSNFINGNGGNDTIIGSTGPDSGIDTILGGTGDDSVSDTQPGDSVRP